MRLQPAKPERRPSLPKTTIGVWPVEVSPKAQRKVWPSNVVGSMSVGGVGVEQAERRRAAAAAPAKVMRFMLGP